MTGLEARLTEDMIQLRTDVLDKVPMHVCNAVLSSFHINGAVPLTREYLDSCLTSLREAVSINAQANTTHDQPGTADFASVATFAWGGRLHPRPPPEDFVLPKCKLRCFDLKKRGDSSKLFKAHKVIAIQTIKKEAWLPWVQCHASLLTSSMMQLVTPDEWAARRVNEMSYITFYGIVLKQT
ncbi:hypothetical protein ACHHYP_13401 [Achlya hypogyna]|uniref:Uncharacterized protein n=1 Tax=Achlya hypogyna TaxID=1202772 RepID=A0A1V9YFE3_ACHHY|nr:hypothetical protein ACHHYP_13401 [Achlya hypogyna]